MQRRDKLAVIGTGSEEDKRLATQRDSTSIPADFVAVITDLFELLEQYAPPWYTKEHHDKVVSVLNSIKQRPKSLT